MSTTNVAVLLQLFSKHTLASLLSRNPTFRPSCVFLQMARIMLCKTRPDPIWFWLTVSGFGQIDPVQKQASVQESSSCFWPMLSSWSDANWIQHVYWVIYTWLKLKHFTQTWIQTLQDCHFYHYYHNIVLLLLRYHRIYFTWLCTLTLATEALTH